jgi:23S rRNA pseudouridine2604 synthase
MCEAFGFTVEALQRVRIMRIHLGELPLGRWRNLTAEEVATLLPRSPDPGGRSGSPPREGRAPHHTARSDRAPHHTARSGPPPREGRAPASRPPQGRSHRRGGR